MERTDGARDLQALLSALDEIESNATPVRFLAGQVWIDRHEVYTILDQMRAALPESIKRLRWYREKRQDAGEPRPAVPESSAVDALRPIDDLDDLLHHAPTALLGVRVVRVKRDRLSWLLEKLRSTLGPPAQELAVYEREGDDG